MASLWWLNISIIYLARDGETLLVLFGGGTKRRQQEDISRARELHAEYKARKAALKRNKDRRTSRKKRCSQWR